MTRPSVNRSRIFPAITIGSAAACICLAASTPASANGRYPSAGQILVDPADPDHLWIRATYGVLTTSDGGERWSWICEPAIGYIGIEDPMMVLTGDGSILVGLFGGLSATHDRGCQWELGAGGVADRNIVDLSIDRAEPGSVILLGSSVLGSDEILTQVWESKDDGRTWAQAGVDLPSTFLGVTLDSAPSDPRRLYVSGRWNGPSFQGILKRSMDRGRTWEDFDVPGSDERNLPYIGAVDPVDPDVVYVRRDGDEADTLLVTRDGGATWEEVFQAASLVGLALSPDGSKIAVGSDYGGLWTAPTATLTFTPVRNLGVRCLTWTPRGLFACADEFVDGFTAGISTDEGQTFSPLMTLDRLCGPPPACGSDSETGEACPALWPATASFLGAAGSCDAGAGASGTATAGGGGAGESGTGAGAGGSGTGAAAGGGCACEASGKGRHGGLLGCMIVAAGVLCGARRRARKASSGRMALGVRAGPS
ncbi:WD40/YVTN/BNR-like repeat-containing protein [Sorangium sp. So ce131]|uniref:WD40/YVTN/BNR-like repeat-containing protein n=1 Tax=Sorangium sp. So ce131 TaxID=3133282 RepID=UPI003F607452